VAFLLAQAGYKDPGALHGGLEAWKAIGGNVVMAEGRQ
jgi:rhodanese-related sulfurtransferase